MAVDPQRLYEEMFDPRKAAEECLALGPRARGLAVELSREEAAEIFRRVANNEIEAGTFVRKFADAFAAADVFNQAILLPAAYMLLVKYPNLIGRHRERPALKSFPPEG